MKPYFVIKELVKILSKTSGSLARKEAEIILCEVLKVNRIKLYLDNIEISKQQLAHSKSIANQRTLGTPLPYVLKSTYFYGRKFYISPDVLIPRPDTETIIEIILKNENANDNLKFLDIGAGSGIIAITLYNECRNWHATALDISKSAIKVAKTNSKNKPINLFCSDKFSAIKKNNHFDFIVSNPPYISEIEFNNLETSVLDNEPHIALKGGEDGLLFYEEIGKNAMDFLHPNGRLYLEIGWQQGNAVKDILKRYKWENIKIFTDLANRPRVISAISPM